MQGGHKVPNPSLIGFSGVLASQVYGAPEVRYERQKKARPMSNERQVAKEVARMLRKSMGLRIQSGSGGHRFIGIWHVVVNDRVFVRSWSVKENGWYRGLLKDPRGAIQVKKLEVAVAARRIANKALRDAIDRAYLEKYKTP